MSISSPAEHPLSGQLLQHEGFVRRLATRLVGEANAAEDVAQDALALALQRNSWERSGLRAWLAGTVRRLARHRGRGEARRRRREAAAARPEALPVSEPLEEQQRVVEAVLALEEPFRETVLLTHYHGLSPAVIARRHGVPAATVRTRLHRAHEKLRNKLIAAHGGDARGWVLALAPFLAADRFGAPVSGPFSVQGVATGFSSLSAPTTAILGVIVVATGVGVWGLRETTLTDPASTPSGSVTAPAPDFRGGNPPATHAPGSRDGQGQERSSRRPVEAKQDPELEARRLAYWEAVRSARETMKWIDERLPEAPADAELRRALEKEIIHPPVVVAGLGLGPVVDLLDDSVDVPLAVTPAALSVGQRRALLLDLELHQPHSLKAILDLLVFLTRVEIVWTLEGGEIRLCTADELVELMITYPHPVADFILRPCDYFAPGDDISPIFAEPIDIDILMNMVYEGLPHYTWVQDSWKEVREGERPFLEYDREIPAVLRVRHSREVHLEIEEHLDLLRGFFLPLPEEGRPGVPVTLDPSTPNRRIAAFLASAPIDSLCGAGAKAVSVGELLAKASEIRRFDTVLIRLDRNVLPAIPRSSSSLASGLDALRSQGISWTLCSGFVVLYPSHAYSARRTTVFRDVRDILTGASIPADRLIGHSALERWATEKDYPFVLTGDCIDQLARDYIDPESWDHDPSNSLRIDDGILVLDQSPAVVAGMDYLLAALRALLE